MSRKREDSDQGSDNPAVADVRSVFDAVEGSVVTSGDVAEALECSRETARRKLRALEERGRVASRKTAGRVVQWRTTSTTAADVNPDDLFWELEPGRSGEHNVSEHVDEDLY